MIQYVVVYDRATGETSISEFSGPSASQEALSARFAAERLARSNQEVAIVSARSRDALARTHSRYFKGVAGAIDDLAAATA
ncbi:hypothetical protein [Microbacterium sp. K2]|uniref:hypothetical protein n=1 Tax=Microbacterium sp. K2 TaxID=3391827 RepID=UPI003ED90900